MRRNALFAKAEAVKVYIEGLRFDVLHKNSLGFISKDKFSREVFDYSLKFYA